MSELATEISSSEDLVTDIEFLGKSFSERKDALRQVDAFKKFTEQALFDSVAVFVGQEVSLTFRPSSITTRQYPGISVSCYSQSDGEREPLTRDVTIRKVVNDTAVVTQGDLLDGIYDAKWAVGIRNIVSINQLEDEAIS